MTNSDRTILIIEPHSDGHHMQYVRYAASSMIDHGLKVFLATLPESIDNPAYKEMQEACANRIEVLFINKSISNHWRPGPLGTLVRHFAYYNLFKDFWNTSAEAKQSSVIFIPYLDYCDKVFSTFGSPFGSTPWSGLLMRPSFHYPAMGVIAPSSPLDTPECFLLNTLLRRKNLHVLFTADEPLYLYVQSFWKQYANKIKYVLEPADLDEPLPQDAARKALGLPANKKILLVYGSLTLRKGVDTLLQAFASPSFPKDWACFFAGKQDDEVRGITSSEPCRQLKSKGIMFETDRYLNRQEQTFAFCASDAAWLGYRNHYSSSGVLSQAMAIGLPIIGCKEGVIGWTLSRYEHGCLLDDRTVPSILKSFTQLRPSSSDFNKGRYDARFSIARFGSDVLSGLL